MSRRGSGAAEAAASAASEAARVLQQRGQEARAESRAESVEPAAEPSDMSHPARSEARQKADPRTRMMEEIEAREASQRGDPEPAPEPEVAKTETPPVENMKDVPTAPVTVQDGISVAEAPLPVTMQEMVRVKVDGEEFDVPKAEVDDAGGIKPYQIIRATQNRLKQAQASLAETNQLRQNLVAWAQQQAAAQQQNQGKAQNEALAAALQKIRYGTDEEALPAFMQAMQSFAPKIDPDAIVNASMTKMQQQLAGERFKTDFPEIVANPLALKLASTLENERLAQTRGPIDWHGFYATIGNEVRSLLGPRQHQPTAQTPNTTADSTSPVTSEKEARKASITTLPTAAARAAMPAETKPESREEILNAARKARGFQT